MYFADISASVYSIVLVGRPDVSGGARLSIAEVDSPGNRGKLQIVFPRDEPAGKVKSSQMAPLTRPPGTIRRIPSLDGLRTLSIAMVLAGHLYGTAGYPQNWFTRQLSQFAHLGVQIFFVISGYLITTLLLKEKEKTGSVSFTHFYLRRTLRIFPAAFFYITVMAVIFKPGYLLWAYTYTMCYAGQARPWVLGHLWSLSVEEQFYLLWPAIMVLGFAWRKQAGIVILLLAPVARLLFWNAGMHDIDEYFPAVADNLMMGCLLAFFYPALRQRFAWLTRPAVFALLGILTVFSPHLLPRVRLEIAFGGLIPFIIALFIFAAIERADWFLNNRLTGALGVLSYSLYLWQQLFLDRRQHTWWTAFPVNLLLALACAVASYYVVERPFLGMFRGTGRKTPDSHLKPTEIAV
jgi:peptidoglycan/LPS O-acetylase OafA/YrhL